MQELSWASTLTARSTQMGCRGLRLPGLTHAHTTHLYTRTRYPSGDEHRATPGNSAPTGLEPGRAARPLPELATGPLVHTQIDAM